MTAFCEIIFENAKKVFYTGHSVRGSVHLTLYNEQKVNEINVKINGVAITICHSSNIGKNCLSSGLELLGEQLLEAGTHKFPFRFKLPTQLPSSFDGEYGFIRYTVTVKVEYPTEPSQEIERRITIIKSQDVCHPDFQRPVSLNKGFNPYFILFCIPWYPLKIDAHLDHAAYAPNSIINVGINANNKTLRKVHNFFVHLIQEVTYIPDLKSTSILKEKKLRGCDQNQKHTTCLGCQIKVPETSPSDSSSIIIKIRHFIRIIAVMAGNYRPKLELPITIVALQESPKVGESQKSPKIQEFPPLQQHQLPSTSTATST